MHVCGMDGCRLGWFGVLQWHSTIAGIVVKETNEIEALADLVEVLTIDIPIGLSDTGERGCDKKARAVLKPLRQNTVYAAPCRDVLEASDYDSARQVSLMRCGKSLSRQTWNLVKKIKQIDELLWSRKDLRQKVKEVHPEVSFCLWAGKPMAHSKKVLAGRLERLALVETEFPGVFERLRKNPAFSSVQDDDILDAIAALWTARRIVKGEAIELISNPEPDRTGLMMRIYA